MRLSCLANRQFVAILDNGYKVLTDCLFLLALRVFGIEQKHLNTTVRIGAQTNVAFFGF